MLAFGVQVTKNSTKKGREINIDGVIQFLADLLDNRTEVISIEAHYSLDKKLTEQF